jgi:predicted MPP superfamily phosphohydrolase
MGTRSVTALALAVAVVGLVALGAVLRRRREQLRLLEVALVGAAMAVGTFLAALPIVAASDHSSLFEVSHLLYLVAVVAVPVVAVALALASLRLGATRPVIATTVAMALLAPIGFHATHVAPFDLQVEQVAIELPPERAGTDPLRVGILSDIQTNAITSYEHRAIDELLALEPDIVLIAGDLFQGNAEQFAEQLEPFRDLLARIEAPGGVYAVRGDTDTGDLPDQLVEGTSIEILDDEVVTATIGDRTVRIGGNRLLWAPPPAVAVRKELMASDPGEVRLLVAHRPDVVLNLPPDADVDLTVAGHTHGGQVAIPGYGPPVTFSRVPRSVGAGGLHEVDGNAIFVSTGVGMERNQAPQVRLFTRPMVGLAVLS